MLNEKKVVLTFILLAMTSVATAASCNYTPDPKGFKMSFTGYGLPDKSYDVKDNTFKKYQLDSADGKLLNGSIVINTESVDTSADARDWSRKKNWPAPTIKLRDKNIVDGLFKHFVDGKHIKATVVGIKAGSLDLSVTMNGVSKIIPMKYVIKNGVLSAQGKVELTDFNTAKALKAFNLLCTATWHKGKTWTDVDIFFAVPVKESGC